MKNLRAVVGPFLFIVGLPAAGWFFRTEISEILKLVPGWFWVLVLFVLYPFRSLLDKVFETWAQELEFALIRWGILSSFYFRALSGTVSNRNEKKTFALSLDADVTNRLTIPNILTLL